MKRLAFALLVLATPASAADNCTVLQQNLVAMQGRADAAMAKAGKRQSSARKLAVIEAARAQGFYMAMQTTLPLACKGDDLKVLAERVASDTQRMQDYVQGNW